MPTYEPPPLVGPDHQDHALQQYIGALIARSHPHHSFHTDAELRDIKRAYYAGRVIQFVRAPSTPQWTDVEPPAFGLNFGQWRQHLGATWHDVLEYRIKPGQVPLPPEAPPAPVTIRLDELEQGQCGIVVDYSTFRGCLVMRVEEHDAWSDVIAINLKDTRAQEPGAGLHPGAVFDTSYRNMQVRPLNCVFEGVV